MALAQVASPRVTSGNDGRFTTGSSLTLTLTSLCRHLLFDVAAAAARTAITLPTAASVPVGTILRATDMVGNATANNITFAAASGDTLTGTATITTAYKEAYFISDGVLTWARILGSN